MKPRKEEPYATKMAREVIDDYNMELPEGYTAWGTDTVCGYCDSRNKIITIPMWAVRSKRRGRLVQYVAHEIAHAWTEDERGHGKNFMEYMMILCPEEYWHFETEYKPRLAKAAGISKR